jgi:hypothetical protein
LEKEGKLTRLVHIYWSKASTKENSIFENFEFPVEMLISAIFLSGIFFKFSHHIFTKITKSSFLIFYKVFL